MGKICVVIPARYASTRYPGKPLVDILGRPMIIWVAEAAAKALDPSDVYVATDNKLIVETVTSFGYQAILTSDSAMTGTDRVAEAAKNLDYEVFVNVQGDEPLVSSTDIKKIAAAKLQQPQYIINGVCDIDNQQDATNRNIPKVVTNEMNELLYMSRSAIPMSKETAINSSTYRKQVCIYSYSREDLQAFEKFGRKSYLESIEDIEILRFFDIGKKVLMVETAPGSVAVDIPTDVPVVENAMRALDHD